MEDKKRQDNIPPFCKKSMIFKKNIKIDYELEKERVKTYVYYVADKEVVGVPIYDISSNKYTQIKEVFMYLTQKSNYVPSLPVNF